jgi:Ca-activated chloride channel family protein
MAGGVLVLFVVSLQGQQPPSPAPSMPDEDGRFRSGVELINVTATVSDQSGRFVSGLRKEDFAVYEDDRPVDLTHFTAERVPVSLGIALDTSGSMAGEKIREAERALDRFVYDLLDKQDELFIYRFSNYPTLLQRWTTDRQLITRALGRITPGGGTALYDAVVEAIPRAATGQNQKKALVVISDGIDTASRAEIPDVKEQIRKSQVLVYAIGIDGEADSTHPWTSPPWRVPVPFSFPPRGRFPFGALSQIGAQGRNGGWARSRSGDGVDVAALRAMTDDSGGRTDVVRDPHDLDPVTAAIADELRNQYDLGYVLTGKKDGRWHTIRVEVRNSSYRVRARKGYLAS